MNAVEINYPIGTKVIIRSNEPEPLYVGHITSYEERFNEPIITLESGQEVLCGGSIAWYTEERYKALCKLTWDEQYNVMSKFDCITASDVARKNKASNYA